MVAPQVQWLVPRWQEKGRKGRCRCNLQGYLVELILHPTAFTHPFCDNNDRRFLVEIWGAIINNSAPPVNWTQPPSVPGNFESKSRK
jgi:hypothetical protein